MPDELNVSFQQQTTFKKDKTGKFEIHAMTAGEGNGWQIDADVLEKSLQLWDKANSFVDHSLWGHSVRDLCGVLTNPTWDNEAKGVKITFTPFGPSAQIAEVLAQDIIDNPGLTDRVGFSADIVFTATGKHVDQILRVNSTDLVIDPARGGKFLRFLQSKEFNHMTEPTNQQIDASLSEAEKKLQQLQSGAKAVLESQNAQNALDKLEATNIAAEKLRVQMSQALLGSVLGASRLPETWQSRIRKDFADKAFEPEELQARIDADRELLSVTTASSVVKSGSIRGMYSQDDYIEAAVDDLFEAPRRTEIEKVQTNRLTGIRELYMLMTGDYNLHGGFHLERGTFAYTTDFTGLVKNALNKVIAQKWDELGKAGFGWWENIVSVEHFETLNDITSILVGTVGTLPTVLEGAEYTEMAVGDSPEVASFVKRGGYIPLTLELIDRDETRKLKAYPRELANATLRTISAQIAAIFTSNSAIGPQMADTGYLFNNTAVTTLGGHANLLTTALSAVAWDAVAQAVYNQPMLIKQATSYYGTGPKQAVEPRYCLVPRALFKTARDTFVNMWDVTVNVHAENLLKGAVVPLAVPEWTDATDWAAVCDPKVAPSIILGERFGIKPEIYIANRETDPAVFMNDEHRLKARHFCAVLVSDFRPLHKSNV